MKILLTGANGYVGQRLLPLLVEIGHKVVAFVRSPHRIHIPPHCRPHVQIIKGDLLDPDAAESIPKDCEAAYYLVHSLTLSKGKLCDLETTAAQNFLLLIQHTKIRQIIYLSGLANDKNLSKHLSSRKRVEELLHESSIPTTTLRAGIILGSGSASFEIMRDLVEKLPIMITPRWVESKCQPIGIYDVLEYLTAVLGHPDCMGQAFDIGGPDIMSYREMMLKFAEIRQLKRLIIGVPVLTPQLSSHWLHFVTSTNLTLARSLINSLKNHAICKDTKIHSVIPKKCLSFEQAILNAFKNIEDDAVLSSWKDAMVMSELNPDLREYIQVPQFGCLSDTQEVPFQGKTEDLIDTIWSIGGKRGWYFMNWAWALRGFIDQVFMGIGLRRGRTHPHRLRRGDVLDFWRVLLADREHQRLLLYAEMRLPGNAWLEFSVDSKADGKQYLKQRAVFRPRGLLGRLYWYSIFPLHWLIFRGMARSIVRYAETEA